uniref:BTB domain-containing protein n=1 Tax=Panagrolaimus davidi TaxID=227884 RepID=A0A914PSR6_9BILA
MSWEHYNSSDSDATWYDSDDIYERYPRRKVKTTKKKTAENYVYKMQIKKFEFFKSQNLENGHFDVVFEIDGKLLYAHKYDLVSASETLNAMLSDRWRIKNEPVKIESFTYKIFYQFCCFIYCGECQLNMKTVAKIVDASEFFGFEFLKNYCEDFLMENKKNINEKNIYEFCELVQKYKFKRFGGYICDTIHRNFYILIRDKDFVSLSKSQIECFFMIDYRKNEEEFFEALYKWSENQAMIKKSVSIEENFDLEEAIKNEFNDFKPRIRFDDMDYDYGIEIIATKSFLFSSSELKKIASDFDVCESDFE